MSDQQQALTYTDVRNLLDQSELADVVLYQISGSRVEEPGEAGYKLQVLTRVEDSEFEIRCQATVVGNGGQYLADAGAVFKFAAVGEIEEGTAREFAEKVGVMTVYPYLRAAVAQTAASLGLDRPVLPLLRAGSVALTKNQDQNEAAQVAP